MVLISSWVIKSFWRSSSGLILYAGHLFWTGLNKKQEFNGGEILYNNLDCDNKNYSDLFSKIIKVDQSKLCRNNYDLFNVSLCFRKDDVKILLNDNYGYQSLKLSKIFFNNDPSKTFDVSKKTCLSKKCDIKVMLPKNLNIKSLNLIKEKELIH